MTNRRKLNQWLKEMSWFVVFDPVRPGCLTIYQPGGIDDPLNGWKNKDNHILMPVLTITMSTNADALDKLEQELRYRRSETLTSPLTSSMFQ